MSDNRLRFPDKQPDYWRHLIVFAMVTVIMTLIVLLGVLVAQAVMR
jgi:hypothetical protein